MLEQLVPRVRTLTADDLGIGVTEPAADSSSPDAPEIPPDNKMIDEIIRLATMSGGVILSGPPGTSKSFYAALAADTMTGGDESRYRFVQFHASYQYEDFMSGFRPKDDGGFAPRNGPFLDLVSEAGKNPDKTYVLVIDELSRADVGRVFGEALTYVERTKRELPFLIANGDEIRVPSNLVIVATMNPFDRGVDEVDAAFERRFAKISMDPDANLLNRILTANGMDATLQNRVIAWFTAINGRARKNPAAAVGHAYFSTASDEKSLRDIWDYQLKYLVHRAFRRDDNTLADVETSWNRIFDVPVASAEEPATTASTEPEAPA